VTPNPNDPNPNDPAPNDPAPRRPQRPDRRHGSEAAQRWREALAARYPACPDAAARAALLQELDLPYVLDEPTALALYAVQPALSSEFVVRHLPRGRRADDARLPWTQLMGRALGRGDQALHFALYRIQAGAAEWERDTNELVRRISDAQALCAELEQRHPQRWRADVGPHLVTLARDRGQHMLPYLERHAGEVWSPSRRSGYAEMAELAQRRGWWELWATLIRTCAGPGQYDREVMALLQDTGADEASLRQRLLVLAGVWSPLGGARRPGRLKPLREETLLALYRRFPHLARGPFRPQLDPGPTRPLSRLIALALEQADEDLIDHLATRLGVLGPRSGGERLLESARRIGVHLVSTARGEDALDQRCAAILRRAPGMRGGVQTTTRRNPLARLLVERAARACVSDVQTARTFLDADEATLRAIAARAITALIEAGGAPASDAPSSAQVLLLALAQPLPAGVRKRAVRALARTALSTEEREQVAAWARQFLARRPAHAADTDVLTLLAHQLAAVPALRLDGEVPLVRRTPA
jgi:hypothetical protein